MSKYQYRATRAGVDCWETPHFDTKKEADWWLSSLDPMWKKEDTLIELVVKPNREVTDDRA